MVGLDCWGWKAIFSGHFGGQAGKDGEDCTYISRYRVTLGAVLLEGKSNRKKRPGDSDRFMVILKFWQKDQYFLAAQGWNKDYQAAAKE